VTSVRFACPECRRELAAGEDTCPSCAQRYEPVDGIRNFVPPRAHSQEQAAYFDYAVDAEWEISRPHVAPRLYQWLLAEKFRRSIEGLPLRGASVLAVCAGSGMDAELLARAGAGTVVAADISAGAARRTAERARRYGVSITPVVADVEHLPFPDRSFDIVYVHDGLHHLEDPYAGLAEMARAARHAVSVSEPARAAATALALKLGLAEEREEAGNRVARLDVREVSAALERAGFRVVRRERYAMLYRHEPRWAMRALSLPLIVPVARAAVTAANAVAGRLGNKLVVLAVRP
jgi:ubiquinone/menaquinone biosynthesis C-methylase UbiE